MSNDFVKKPLGYEVKREGEKSSNPGGPPVRTRNMASAHGEDGKCLTTHGPWHIHCILCMEWPPSTLSKASHVPSSMRVGSNLHMRGPRGDGLTADRGRGFPNGENGVPWSR